MFTHFLKNDKDDGVGEDETGVLLDEIGGRGSGNKPFPLAA